MTKHIQPIGPIRPITFGDIDYRLLLSVNLKLLCVLLFLTCIYFISKKIISKTPGFQKENKKIPIYHGIALFIVSSLLIAFGFSLGTLKGIIFALILLYASVSDIQTHSVYDSVSVMILITGLISVGKSQIIFNLISALMVFAFLFVCAIVSGNKFGGADVKLSAACVFLLGLQKGVAGLAIGLFLSIVSNMILKTKDKAFPLVPYLSIGFMTMYFM